MKISEEIKVLNRTEWFIDLFSLSQSDVNGFKSIKPNSAEN